MVPRPIRVLLPSLLVFSAERRLNDSLLSLGRLVYVYTTLITFPPLNSNALTVQLFVVTNIKRAKLAGLVQDASSSLSVHAWR